MTHDPDQEDYRDHLRTRVSALYLLRDEIRCEQNITVHLAQRAGIPVGELAKLTRQTPEQIKDIVLGWDPLGSVPDVEPDPDDSFEWDENPKWDTFLHPKARSR